MNKLNILITGGDGYLGSRIAQKYLKNSSENVLLWVRANDEQEFATKANKLQTQFEQFGSRISYHWGDLRHPYPFATLNPSNISLIIHAASVIRFNVDEETAKKVNIEGTEKLLKFSEKCKFLEGVSLLSTVYASGMKSGIIKEVAFDNQAGFANYYEWSKWSSEMLLLNQFSHLPWRIFRLATVIADNEDGEVSQYNAFHNTLKLLYYGLLSLIPGHPTTPLYFVTGDFITEAIIHLMTSSTLQSIYHFAHTKSESICLNDIIDLAFTTFSQNEDFLRRRVLKPLYSDEESFQLLVQGVNDFGSSIVNQAVKSVSPFAGQLFVDKDVQNQQLVAAYNHYQSPDAKQLIQNTCQTLIQTKWGK